ncbi:hypothetical protein PG994_000319 [Apiospora phragmitis]|uniref:Protein kinase domain-containing protein n=1 Tax=Apiospora phragmitis TaxID=2905665 RepID=A0ABR1X648_9PEZI
MSSDNAGSYMWIDEQPNTPGDNEDSNANSNIPEWSWDEPMTDTDYDTATSAFLTSGDSLEAILPFQNGRRAWRGPANANDLNIELPPPPTNELQAIKDYFLGSRSNGRYEYEGHISSGYFGSVHGLRWRGQSSATTDITSSSSSSSGRQRRTCWILFDILEGGTFLRLIECIEARKKPVPNRFIWKVFGCFIRIAAAMLYQNGLDKGPVRLEEWPADGAGHPESVVLNKDIYNHPNNLMFGAFHELSAEPENSLTPILKMIDLGIMCRVDTSTDESWIEVVQRIEEELIYSVSTFLPAFSGKGLSSPTFDDILTKDISEPAKPCQCRPARGEKDPRSSPEGAPLGVPQRELHVQGWTFRQLADRVEEGMRRGADWYKGKKNFNEGEEDDEHILKEVQELFADADVIESEDISIPDLSYEDHNQLI